MTDLTQMISPPGSRVLKQEAGFIVLLILALILFSNQHSEASERRNFREEMRRLVETISYLGKSAGHRFYVIPQNGLELLGEENPSSPSGPADYLRAIDGVGQESLHYGYPDDDAPTGAAEQDRLYALLDLVRKHHKVVLVTDYCHTPSHIRDAYQRSARHGYIGFVAAGRELDGIPGPPPAPFGFNNRDIQSLGDIRNFLLLLNSGAYRDQEDFLQALRSTDYDCLIIDPYFGGDRPLFGSEIASLKVKQNGGRRLVMAYLSIGEAEDYRYYWQPGWNKDRPEWLEEENPDWPGDFKVRYWHKEWQDILFGPGDSCLKRIMAVDFDGVYLDIIDAFQYFEEKQPRMTGPP